MKKHIFPVLIAMSILLTACGTYAAKDSAAKSISIYRELKPDYQTGGQLIQGEKIALDINADLLDAAISGLNAAPENDKLCNPLPEGVKLLSASLHGNCVTVKMNSSYLDVAGIKKSMLDCCITMTMCSIDNVDFVTICVGDEVVADKLSMDDYLLFNTIKDSNTAQVRLYFPKSSGNVLGSEYRAISFDDNNAAERCILDALLGGPASGKLVRSFPAGTVLQSVYTQDGICTVSLSDFSAEVENPTSTDAQLTVYSLVNSLTEISDIQSVQILLDGAQVQDLWGFDISHPLTRNESIIGSAVTGQTETK